MFDQYFCPLLGIKDFAIEQLIAQLTIEALDVAVFPGSFPPYKLDQVLNGQVSYAGKYLDNKYQKPTKAAA